LPSDNTRYVRAVLEFYRPPPRSPQHLSRPFFFGRNRLPRFYISAAAVQASPSRTGSLVRLPPPHVFFLPLFRRAVSLAYEPRCDAAFLIMFCWCYFFLISSGDVALMNLIYSSPLFFDLVASFCYIDLFRVFLSQRRKVVLDSHFPCGGDDGTAVSLRPLLFVIPPPFVFASSFEILCSIQRLALAFCTAESFRNDPGSGLLVRTLSLPLQPLVIHLIVGLILQGRPLLFPCLVAPTRLLLPLPPPSTDSRRIRSSRGFPGALPLFDFFWATPCGWRTAHRVRLRRQNVILFSFGVRRPLLPAGASCLVLTTSPAPLTILSSRVSFCMVF